MTLLVVVQFHVLDQVHRIPVAGSIVAANPKNVPQKQSAWIGGKGGRWG